MSKLSDEDRALIERIGPTLNPIFLKHAMAREGTLSRLLDAVRAEEREKIAVSQSQPVLASNGQCEGSAPVEEPWPLPPGIPGYTDALALVRHFQKPSVSFIQRRLQIGYNLAASFIERMEAEGVCSKASHAGVRLMLSTPPQTTEGAG